MASLAPWIKSSPFFMTPDHFTMDQMYEPKINDNHFSLLGHMEQKLITALPWIWVLIVYQTKDIPEIWDKG